MQRQKQQQQQQQPGAAPGTADDDPSRIWLPEVVHHFASFLGGNEQACTLRLVNKATATQFRGPQHTTIRLSQQVPHHAFAWRWGGGGATRGLTVRQRQQLPCLTARSGSIANLALLLARDDLTSPLEHRVMVDAVEAGQLEACRWLLQQGCLWSDGVLDVAAGAGHKEVCEWLLAVGGTFSADPVRYAAAGGHWELCEWLLAQDCSVEDQAAIAAARGGYMGLIDWLLERTVRFPNTWDLMEAVASGCNLPTLQRLHHTYVDTPYAQMSAAGELSDAEELLGGEQGWVTAAAAGSPTADWRDKVEWLETRGYPLTDIACRDIAAREDCREALEWLQQRGYPFTAGMAHYVAQNGDADALEFLLAQGVHLDTAPAASYAPRGHDHLATLKLLHARRVCIGHRNVASAAANGQLPVVAWLVEVLGAATALTAGVYARAARSGSAELLAWLHEAGCPWDASAFAEAAASGSEEQLEWLVECGCPMGDDGDPYRRALANADLAVLRCLRQLGCPWGPVGLTFTCAIKACDASTPFSQTQLLLALAWLVEQGCPVDCCRAGGRGVG
ncbi:Ankyrin repeat domain-containing protein [Tetrabaena socialis]|uniref:Ankyrin repeat domain-containing protein n=1 Tax=Tetrabaena socialis TaxID=47790 RepID=A0A2J8AFM8_9CHLO|nr:Ankyrin repeat domain-containing protein [Tetrabaena socialis]|eukprot:PNH11306.1 Ankyrin repeat domain-containing protein [Tetrabaena socialis]